MSSFNGHDRMEGKAPLMPVAGIDPPAIAIALACYRFTYDEATHSILDPEFAPPKLIMRFRAAMDGSGYDQLTTQMQNYYVKYLITHLPAELKDPLQQALGKNLSKINGSYPEYVGGREHSFHRDEKLRSYNRRFPQEKREGTFTAAEAKAVGQQQIGLSDANAAYPILGTYGAGPCVIAALYNPATSASLLTHIDEGTDLASLTPFVQSLGTEILELHLSGGSIAGRKVSEIDRYFRQFANIKLKSCYLNPDSGEQLALDARNGKIYTDFSVNALAPNPLPKSWRDPDFYKSPSVKVAYDFREADPQTQTHTERLNAADHSAFSRGSKHTRPTPRTGGWAENET